MISYCVACYRPVYVRQLIDELIRKTSAPYEILLWLNVADSDFDAFLRCHAAAGAPLRILGRTPENIGMAAYPRLFAAAKFDLIAQIDDDIVSITPQIAETARAAFDRHPSLGMITADVWQDEYTTGARPPLEVYRPADEEFGLFDGPIDGWFAIYRRASLQHCRQLRPTRYYYLGAAIRGPAAGGGPMRLLVHANESLPRNWSRVRVLFWNARRGDRKVPRARTSGHRAVVPGCAARTSLEGGFGSARDAHSRLPVRYSPWVKTTPAGGEVHPPESPSF